MNIKIVRIDTSLPLPEYHTEGAVAFDLYARETIEIQPRSVFRIPTNFIVEIPKGFMLYCKDRSSTAMRKNLLATAGIIDQDFCGPENEILFQVFNFSDDIITVERGERIGQAMLVRIETAIFEEVDHIAEKSRGSFGSTGH